MSDAEIIAAARLQLARGSDPADVADYMLDAWVERTRYVPSRDDEVA